ncbi:hypothetical protein AB0M71_22145 [Amycolatopsis sp. NPDC051114]|uniref:hypothetical protein n=1 Tax=Amycolatopsis sp. NPDC051114 TaxID=3155280 RepID=UPI00341FF391
MANTAAMAASGIGVDAPTGVLVEAAGALVQQAFARAAGADFAFWAACSARGVETMNSRGITAFLDAGATEGVLRGQARLDEDHRLNGWAVSAMLVNDFVIGAKARSRPVRRARADAHRAPSARFRQGVPRRCPADLHRGVPRPVRPECGPWSWSCSSSFDSTSKPERAGVLTGAAPSA